MPYVRNLAICCIAPTNVSVSGSISVSGQIVAVRTEGSTTKAYAYHVWANSNGIVMAVNRFIGPFHH